MSDQAAAVLVVVILLGALAFALVISRDTRPQWLTCPWCLRIRPGHLVHAKGCDACHPST